MVQRLEGHAGGQRAVTDHRNGLAITALQAGGNGHAQRGTDRGAGVADAKGVVLALGAAREGGDAVLLAQGAHALAPAGEDLMRIRLMAHVPHQPVVRGVEDVMQRDGQLDHAQAGTEMPTGLTDRVEQFQAQFIGQGSPARLRLDDAGRPAYRTVEQGRGRALAGNLLKRRGHQANRYRYKKRRQFTSSIANCPRRAPNLADMRRYWPLLSVAAFDDIPRQGRAVASAAASNGRRACRAWSRSSRAVGLGSVETEAAQDKSVCPVGAEC